MHRQKQQAHGDRHGNGALLHPLHRGHCRLAVEHPWQPCAVLGDHRLLLLVEGCIDSPATYKDGHVLALRLRVRLAVFLGQPAAADRHVAVPDGNPEAATGTVRGHVPRWVGELLCKDVVDVLKHRLPTRVVAELGIAGARRDDLSCGTDPITRHPDEAWYRPRRHGIMEPRHDRLEHLVLLHLPLHDPPGLRHELRLGSSNCLRVDA
mmetsp:Transcript_33302/g.105474  ORF Transcript_33302/g.105474 Transcript_33302/m.105474 type:complete len:208 (+) Transcript_33302:239-862(+)